MKLWYYAFIGAGAALVISFVQVYHANKSASVVPNSFSAAQVWQPVALQQPYTSELAPENLGKAFIPEETVILKPKTPVLAVFNESFIDTEFSTITRHGILAKDETLDTFLYSAGLNSKERAEVALAMAAEYDLRKLKPGYGIELEVSFSGSLRRAVLSVDGGVQIEALFADETVVRKIIPEPDLVHRAADTTVKSSIFATLASANIPARFAVDLAEVLSGTIDFRRDLRGGESLQLNWKEATVDDLVIDQPRLSFAALSIDGTLYEVVWPDDQTENVTIFVDGELLRLFAPPVKGARLSSVYGNRRHPVFGDMRMHTGVDFAAPLGTPVYATAPGNISFIGSRGGYGRVVEIAHGSDTMTRYAHLSSVPKGLTTGDRVTAGDLIGRVGSTGTATGPNLHYEVRVDGRPTDPMSQEQLAYADSAEQNNGNLKARLRKSRAQISELLDKVAVEKKLERL